MVRLVLVAAALLVLAGGAASGARRPSPFASERQVRSTWLAELETRARQAPSTRFPSPSRATLLIRLRREAKRYHFRVRGLRIMHPVQAAPLIVVEAPRPALFARQTQAILRSIDPKARTNDDRTGWAYEGFLFEAKDAGGVPFLIVYNFWRGRSPGGGEWARSGSLYPFPHG